MHLLGLTVVLSTCLWCQATRAVKARNCKCPCAVHAKHLLRDL